MKRYLYLLLAMIIAIVIFIYIFINRNHNYNDFKNAIEKKDSVIIRINDEPTSLDPHKGNDLLTFMVHCQIYDTLIMEDSKGLLVPGLAKDWVIAEDGKSIIFKLREDVKFHNGDNMTADDVVFSFNRAIKSNPTSRITGSMDNMEKLDNNTVKLYLKHTYGPILDCIATSNMSIVSKNAVESNEEQFAIAPIGTGPYKLTKWNKSKELIFESFTDYYRGEASIENLTFKIISDNTLAYKALVNSEIDVMLNPAIADRENLINNENLSFYETESNSLYFIAFNNETGLFSNKLLRDAISYAINREALINKALDGNGVPIESVIPTNCFGSPQYFKGNTYDIEKSKQLLVEAGYSGGLSITIPTMHYEITNVLSNQLEEIGIDVEIMRMERNDWLQEIYNFNNYEITVGSYSAIVPDADQITYNRYHGNFIGNGNNIVRCNITELNDALDKGRYSQVIEDRKAAYLTVSEIIKNESIIIPLFTSMNYIVSNKDIKGVQSHSTQRICVYDYYWK